MRERKVTIKDQKQLETTKLPSLFSGDVSGPKVMVVSIFILNQAKHKTFWVHGFFCETNTAMSLHIFRLLHPGMPFVISDLLSSTPFAADKQCHVWPRALPIHFTHTIL